MPQQSRMNPFMWTCATLCWLCLLFVGCVFVVVMACMAAIVNAFAIGIKRTFQGMMHSTFNALMIATLVSQSVFVKWHVIQYVPTPCETAPGNSTAPAQSCYDKIEKDVTREFPGMDAAKSFVQSHPQQSFLDKYRATITNVVIETPHL